MPEQTFLFTLIKHAKNPIKDGHKLIKQTYKPIKVRFLWNTFFQRKNYKRGAEILAYASLTHHGILALQFFIVKRMEGPNSYNC